MADLEGVKSRLMEVLKERTARYWELMKSWYKRKVRCAALSAGAMHSRPSFQIAKEDFDSKAKALLGDGNVHLHNEFLFAILVKCQTGLQPTPGIVR